jgi:DNA integrity scanning protein DisA with diadenylate cyclase activity
MNQLSILSPPSTIDQAFWNFHRKNPQVYQKIIEMTRAAKQRGKRKIGMKMLFEVIRWEHLVHTRSDDFALNNNYTSRYARLLFEEYPELAQMFETRRIKS